VFVERFTPFRERTLALMDDPDGLHDILAHGASRAAVVASDTLRAVYDRIGFVPGSR
jgi:tryptophanyl-tRNA synthetase